MKLLNYFEQENRGTPLFPAEYHYLDKTHPRYVMPAHWHHEFEIIRVLSGSFVVYINDTQYTLNSQDVLLVGCGALHRGTPENCAYECIIVDLKMLLLQYPNSVENPLLQMINLQTEIRNPLITMDHVARPIVTQLFSALSKKEPFLEFSVYGLLFSLLYQLYSAGDVYTRNSSDINSSLKSIAAVTDWINKNFSEPIRLEDLSRIAQVTPKYLCRLFKAYTGKTIVQYVNEIRIENACYEMLERNKNVTEAAFFCGFNDLSYFAKIFKRHKGISPKHFKALYRPQT